MKRLILFILLLSFTNSFAQQVYGVQRGQRGYIPPPKFESSVYVTTINAYDEIIYMSMILYSKCMRKCSVFKLCHSIFSYILLPYHIK